MLITYSDSILETGNSPLMIFGIIIWKFQKKWLPLQTKGNDFLPLK